MPHDIAALKAGLAAKPDAGPGCEPGAEPGAEPDAELSADRARLLAVGPLPARILIVTDAWLPQVNGVVRTLATIAHELSDMGHTVEVIGPDRFRTAPLPSYPDIRIALLPRRRLGKLVEAFAPDALHIATEGPLGGAARAWARKRGCAFTTAFHTKFPEYVQARIGLPLRWTYAWMRRFHAAGQGMMVATFSLREELAARGFKLLRPWSRGVDLDLFSPAARGTGPDPFAGLPRPVSLYVGRVSVEKNIEAMLALDLPGSKVVVGDGPRLPALRREFPSAHYLGELHGEALARAYAWADVFVFPSRSDTFGLVLLEALACGTPVAAYPVTGPRDVLADADPRAGALDEDLREAVRRALALGDRAACRAHAQRFGWRACAETFLSHLVPLGGH